MNDRKPSSTVPTPVSGRDAIPDRNGAEQAGKKREIGGPRGPEPTRYGDWEKAGKCVDF